MRWPIRSVALILGACLVCSAAWADDPWRPAKVPLMTRWGKALTPASVLPEYPRPQMVRSAWQNLNGLWDYAVTRKDAEAPTVYQGRILVPFPIESALSGVHKGFYRNNRLWYHRIFDVPKAWANQRVLLHFGAVDWEAAVAVNGKAVGTHRGGYDAFTCDITDALMPAGPQELVVNVLDATGDGQAKGKQTTGNLAGHGTLGYCAASGIWQTAWLEPVPQASVRELRITPDVDAGVVRVKALGRGTADGDAVEAVASDGPRQVARVAGKVGDELVLAIQKARLWSPESPFLYDLSVTLRRPGQAADEVRGYFGMRKVALGKDDKGRVRMMLNGQPVFQIGPLDQGYPPSEWTTPDAIRQNHRVGQFLLRASQQLGVEPDALRDAVYQTVNGPHQGLLLRLRTLEVKGVQESSSVFCCTSCGRVHLHPSAGICSRCLGTVVLDTTRIGFLAQQTPRSPLLTGRWISLSPSLRRGERSSGTGGLGQSRQSQLPSSECGTRGRPVAGRRLSTTSTSYCVRAACIWKLPGPSLVAPMVCHRTRLSEGSRSAQAVPGQRSRRSPAGSQGDSRQMANTGARARISCLVLASFRRR